MNRFAQNFEAELPGGGVVTLHSAEEVDLFETAKDRYIEDYHLTKQNDLMLLGTLLQFQIIQYRAMRSINPQPEIKNGMPTGGVKIPDEGDVAAGTRLLTTATEQAQKIEKALGIDKASREAGGQHTVANYIATLKKAAHERGIHINERVKFMEAFFNDLSTRLRILSNADAEDREYMKISPESICAWAQKEIDAIQEKDKEFAATRGKLYLGRL